MALFDSLFGGNTTTELIPPAEGETYASYVRRGGRVVFMDGGQPAPSAEWDSSLRLWKPAYEKFVKPGLILGGAALVAWWFWRK